MPVRNISANSSDIASGPNPTIGPSSPGASTHHPALRSVPNSLTSTDGRSTNRSRTTPTLGRVVFGGSSRSTRPPWDRCIATRAPPSNSNTTNLPRRPTRSSRTPTSDSGATANVFSPENCNGVAASRATPATAASSRSASACTSGNSGIDLHGRTELPASN